VCDIGSEEHVGSSCPWFGPSTSGKSSQHKIYVYFSCTPTVCARLNVQFIFLYLHVWGRESVILASGYTGAFNFKYLKKKYF
jgi:hypothetical protein